MGEEQNKILFEHYTSLIGGSVKTGNPVYNELVISDAKRHLADLIAKNPGLKVEEVEEVEEAPKKKGKK